MPESAADPAPAPTPDPAPAPPIADVDAILRRAVEEAARLLQTDGAMAYSWTRRPGSCGSPTTPASPTTAAATGSARIKVEVGTGMFGRAVAEGRVIVTGDYQSDTSFVHFPEADRLVHDIDIHSFVVAPLVSGARTYGAMGTFSSRPTPSATPR